MAMNAKEKRDARLETSAKLSKPAVQKSKPDKERAPTTAETTNADVIQHSGAALPAAAGEILKPQSAGAKVVVACKLGVAYFNIQLFKMADKFEQNMQGGRTVKESTRIGGVVRLRGTAYPRGTPPVGFPERPEIVDGAALNYGVDKDFFDTWLEQNKQNPLVMNRMIFAHENLDHVRGQSRDMRDSRSGLDPVNPLGDSRIPRSTRDEVSSVATEDDRAKKLARMTAES